MSEAKLAVFGGRRGVRRAHREKWRKVPPQAIWEIVRSSWRDQNTVAGATGAIADFERRFCALTGTAFGILMNSGTATLHSAYLACGVGPGDEVIVPAYTFFASAAPILACGATPVFCEIDPDTLTAEPDSVESCITAKTKAICVVHVWGNPARLDRFAEIRDRTGIPLIEDCSHAHGALYDGKPVGSWGDIGCFSLQGSKPVSGGEMGIAVTNDRALFERMLVLAHFGRIKQGLGAGRSEIEEFSYGLKYRPHFYGVLLANASLKRIDELNGLRRRNYSILEEELSGCESVCTIAKYEKATRGGMLEFILKYSKEKAGDIPLGSFVAAINAEGVPAGVDRYTCQAAPGQLLHQTRLFQNGAFPGLGGAYRDVSEGKERCRLPVSEDIATRLITLPPFTKVSETFVRQCARAIRKVAETAPKIRDFRVGV